MANLVRKRFYEWKRFVLRSLRATREDSLYGANDEYHQLHLGIMEACRSNSGEPYAVRILDLIKPWADLGALLHTDKHILRDILRKCEAADQAF